ncbi:MAG: hypothetical protein FJX76_03210 [Armatimonadetes bacterium]|nr:hypothetical protein [Armatimonadota bacterium]
MGVLCAGSIAYASVALPARLAAPSPAASGPIKALDTVDDIKARSTLVALVQPAAWITELASHPAQTGAVLAQVGSNLASGNIGAAGAALGGLLGQAVNPTGIARGVYMTGLYMQAGVDALVGAVELHAGFRDNNNALKLMAGADFIGSASSVAFALGNGGTALGLNLASSGARLALIVARPQDYSRIQKAKTVFDGIASASSALMKANIAPVAGLVGYIGFGVTQIVYMNNAGFRGRVDAAVDWVIDKFK